MLRSAARQLRSRRAALALLITREMGKPILQSLAEVDKCAVVAEYYADNGARFLADESYATDADQSWVSYDPIGVIMAVMPWNFPLWQVFRCAAPALMAGNAILLKHSPNTTGCAIEVEKVLAAAGLPGGVFTTLLVAERDVPAVTERLIADPIIGAVTLTGSEQTGSAVGSVAGREIKKCVLELGGSDPFVVLADADVPSAAALAVKARFLNAGQSCISPKRLIVDDTVAAEFTDLLVHAAQQLTVGNPEDPSTDVGPLARADLRDIVAGQVASSVAAGVTLLAGGTTPRATRGYFYAPTVLADVGPGTAAYDEEIFGPVAAVITVHGADHAVQVANATTFGLGASVWGSDIDNAVSVGKHITSGACFINAVVESDPRMPFGGAKRSGYGRELSLAGIREFVSTRSWWVMKEPSADDM